MSIHQHPDLTGPVLPTSPIARVMREADVNPDDLKPARPFRIGQAVLGASEEVAAARDKHTALVNRQRSEITECRQALVAVLQAREDFEKRLSEAALAGKPDPKPVDTSEHLARARHHASQARALSRAVDVAHRELLTLLERYGPEIDRALSERAEGFADDAVRHYDSHLAALETFSGIETERDWLFGLYDESARRFTTPRDWQGQVQGRSIDAARKAVGQ